MVSWLANLGGGQHTCHARAFVNKLYSLLSLLALAYFSLPSPAWGEKQEDSYHRRAKGEASRESEGNEISRPILAAIQSTLLLEKETYKGSWRLNTFLCVYGWERGELCGGSVIDSQIKVSCLSLFLCFLPYGTATPDRFVFFTIYMHIYVLAFSYWHIWHFY